MTERNEERRELTIDELDEVKGAGIFEWALMGTGAAPAGRYLDEHGDIQRIGLG